MDKNAFMGWLRLTYANYESIFADNIYIPLNTVKLRGQKMRKKADKIEPVSTEKLNLLGKRYAKCISIKKELVDAVKQYRNNAEQGDAEAQYMLGCCYQFGDGIIKNKVEAAKWLRESAKQGYWQAQGLLEVIKQDRNTIS